MLTGLSHLTPEYFLTAFDNLEFLIRIALAAFLGIVIGFERASRLKEAGIRTHCIVSMSAAVFMILSKYAFMDVEGVLGLKEADPARICAQVVSGISFLGAGIILVRNNNTIAGLTTAAGMWVTSIIGLAFGYGFYIGGLLTTVICVVNATLLTRLEHKRLQMIRYYVEVNEIEKIQSVLDQIEAMLKEDVFVETIPAKSGIVGNVGFIVSALNRGNQEEIKKALNQIDGISFIVPE